MVDTKLEDIINFSCGIGRSFGEADLALKEAKLHKELGDGQRIVVYSGDAQPDVKIESGARDYLEALEFIKRNDTTGEITQKQIGLTLEPRTGLLNKLGYEVKLLELEALGITQGYYVLFDGDGMKDLNDKIGRTYVDNLIAQAGQGLKASIRTGLDRRHSQENVDYLRRLPGDRRNQPPVKDKNIPDVATDLVGHRVNHDAGDEFLVYVPLPKNDIGIDSMRVLARRVMGNMSKYQIQYLQGTLAGSR